MKLGIVIVALAAVAPPAHAEDTGMKLMGLVMRCPAISSDGKHVAIYSMAGSAEPGSKTSLAVFSAAGKQEQRIGVVPPATSATKAEAAANKIVKLLDDGGYKRMSRVARTSEDRQKLTYSTKLKSEDVELEVAVKDRKVTIREQWKHVVKARSDSAIWRLADLLLRRPVVNARVVADELRLDAGNVHRYINPLLDAGVLAESRDARRNQIWRSAEVLAALDAFAARAGRRMR